MRSRNTNLKSLLQTPSVGKLQITRLEEPAEKAKDIAYSDEISMHRSFIPIYDLYPGTHDCFGAPSATMTGEVVMGRFGQVWYNAVIR